MAGRIKFLVFFVYQMFSIHNQDGPNILKEIPPLINTDRTSNEGNINEKNISIIDQNRTDGSSTEKLTHNQQDMIITNYKNHIEKFSAEKLQFFRLFLWYCYSEKYNWKFLAHSIYHIEHLIHHLDNYQIKEFIQKPFQILINYFIQFIKDLITIQIKSSKHGQSTTPNDGLMSPNSSSETNQIDQHIQNLKTHLNDLKEIILTAKERFNLCKPEINALDTLLQAIENINFDGKTFDQQDQDRIHLLSLKENLSDKSTKSDLMQMKIYIDHQIKNVIELNKQNAKELERIKLLKTSTCQTRHIQSILSPNPSSHTKKPNEIYSHQSSRPYLTFELDHIRQYQKQALLTTPSGTIPLYRRQAWAAANLFPNHSLHYLRYMQNSLRMQIDHSLGYEMCHTNKKKKRNKNSNIEIFNRNEEILIVGNNNKFYRGRITSCEKIPLKKIKEKILKFPIKKEEMNERNRIHFEQFNQTNQTIIDEHLFEYLDWQIQFNEQDLPDELCEELFQHWIAIVCDDQPCSCHSESKFNLIHTQIDSPTVENVYDDRCMCSECSCPCEKYENDASICLCSQCSCQCLKDFQDENQETIEDIPQMSRKHLQLDQDMQEDSPSIFTDQKPLVEQITENQILLSDSQGTNINTICHSIDLDDLISFVNKFSVIIIDEFISFNSKLKNNKQIFISNNCNM